MCGINTKVPPATRLRLASVSWMSEGNGKKDSVMLVSMVVLAVLMFVALGIGLGYYNTQVKWPTQGAEAKLEEIRPKFAIARHRGGRKVMRWSSYHRAWELNEKMIREGKKKPHDPRRFHVKPAFIYQVDPKTQRSYAYQGGQREYDELVHGLL